MFFVLLAAACVLPAAVASADDVVGDSLRATKERTAVLQKEAGADRAARARAGAAAGVQIHSPRAKSDPFYKKELDAGGIKIQSSGKTADAALTAAAQTVRKMTRRADVLANLVAAKIKIAVIARTEVTTDVPEYRHLKGTKTGDGRDWDTGTRGLGGTKEIPTTSVGEENLLKLTPDPYQGEDILTHEFAHGVYLIGIRPAERQAVQAAWAAARKSKAWGEATYAISNVEEYFAEASQAFYDAGQASNPGVNNGVGTREKLHRADPGLEKILVSIYEP